MAILIPWEKYKPFAAPLLRMGLSLVFLWFGISQLVNPESFLGYVPQWLYQHDITMTHSHALQLMHDIPKPDVHFIIMANGVLETVLGLLLILGLWIRGAAFLLGLHLLGIMFSLGYNDIAVRDFGLAMATFVVMLNGNDRWCVPWRRLKN
ncbi:DoxX family membrane protein [Candidatus Woesearchaeota archaeon]|nr:DoxX family membrane protein [Candidatus Woesearchaeota archaeon]